MTAKKRNMNIDYAKIDSRVITPEEYEEAPEISDEDMARGQWLIGGQTGDRGRRASGFRRAPWARAAALGKSQAACDLRLSPDVLETFRSSGKGWQTRIDRALREWLKENAPERRSRPACAPRLRAPSAAG